MNLEDLELLGRAWAKERCCLENNFELQGRVSTALVDFVVADRREPLLQGAGIGELWRRLVLTPTPSKGVAVLPQLVAGRQASGINECFAAVAHAASTTLLELWRQGCSSRGFHLLLLVLRQHLSPRFGRSRLREMHLRVFPDLGRHELALPYSTAFDGRSFNDNVHDLRHGIKASVWDKGVLSSLSLQHLLILHFAAGVPVLSPAECRRRLRFDANVNDDGLRKALLLRSIATGSAGPDELRDAEDLLPRPLLERWCSEPVKFGESVAVDQELALRRVRSPMIQIASAAFLEAVRRSPLRARRSDLKVAVCVSGQLRGYEQALSTWRKNLFDGIEPHFFVHTWSSVGRSGAEPFRENLPFEGERFCHAYRSVALGLGMDEMFRRYPALFASLAASGTVSRQTLAELYSTDHVVVEDDASDEFSTWSNSRKMHYKIHACQSLLERTGVEYDLVFRLRPDKPIRHRGFAWRDLLEASRGTRRVFADHPFGMHFATLLIGDQVALGSQASMKIYTDTYRDWTALVSERVALCDGDFQGHATLAAVCWLRGLEVEKIPLRTGPLQEARVMPANDVLIALEQDCAARRDPWDRQLKTAAEQDISTN